MYYKERFSWRESEIVLEANKGGAVAVSVNGVRVTMGQLEMLRLKSTGLTLEEVADELETSPSTVKNQLYVATSNNIDKFDHSKATVVDLVRVYEEAGLLNQIAIMGIKNVPHEIPVPSVEPIENLPNGTSVAEDLKIVRTIKKEPMTISSGEFTLQINGDLIQQSLLITEDFSISYSQLEVLILIAKGFSHSQIDSLLKSNPGSAKKIVINLLNANGREASADGVNEIVNLLKNYGIFNEISLIGFAEAVNQYSDPHNQISLEKSRSRLAAKIETESVKKKDFIDIVNCSDTKFHLKTKKLQVDYLGIGDYVFTLNQLRILARKGMGQKFRQIAKETKRSEQTLKNTVGTTVKINRKRTGNTRLNLNDLIVICENAGVLDLSIIDQLEEEFERLRSL